MTFLCVGALLGVIGMIVVPSTFGTDVNNALDSAQHALGLAAGGKQLLVVCIQHSVTL